VLRILLNDVHSKNYDQLFNALSQQVSTIAAGLNNLPANIAASLANMQPTPSTTGSVSISPKPMVELLPPLDRLKYEKTKHWTPVTYFKLKSGEVKVEEDEGDIDLDNLNPGTSANGSGSSVKTSITSCYMEDENGEQQPKTTKDAARATARGFWIKLLKDGMAPTTFGGLDVNLKHEYINLMESNYPWLRLCENHWKAERIGHNHYSPWYTGAVKKQAEEAAAAAASKAAAEGRVIDVDADNGGGQYSEGTTSKRPRLDDQTGVSKHRRVDKIKPTPLPITISTKQSRVRLFHPLTLSFTDNTQPNLLYDSLYVEIELLTLLCAVRVSTRPSPSRRRIQPRCVLLGSSHHLL